MDKWTGRESVDATVVDDLPGAPRPKLLLVTDRLPAPDSGYGLRVTNVLEGLRSVGDVDVLVLDSSRRGEQWPERYGDAILLRADAPTRRAKVWRVASRLPTALYYRNHRALLAEAAAVVASRRWDAVWYSRVAAFQYAPVTGTPRIVDFDDLNDRLLRTKMTDRRRQQGTLRTLPRQVWDVLDVARWRRLQQRIARSVERVTVCSRADQRLLGEPNCAVVPNGYPQPATTEARERPADRPPTMLFVGPLSYEPNLFAVAWMIRHVLPAVRERVPGARLVVAGDIEGVKLRGLEHEGVEFLGWVPDVAPVYEATDVAVTPLHSGGGTRLKVIEALARSVPLVSTSFGCDGLDLVAGRELLVADDPSAFTDACVAALGDADLRHRLIAAGRERYVREMSSTACSDAVASVVRSVLSPARRPATERSSTPPGTPS